MSHRRFHLLAISVIILTGLLSGRLPATQAADTQRGSLQSDFAAAAGEFHVPESILLAVSYNLTRWQDHGAQPSTSGGYGPMHLTHVDRLTELDGKGEMVTRSVIRDPALHTLDRAARLLRLSRAALIHDPAQNIRGGAALLAEYGRRTHTRMNTSIARWYGAIALYSGVSQRSGAERFADDVYRTMQTGARAFSDGGWVRLTPQRVSADRTTVRSLHLRSTAATTAECPKSLACQFAPAAYALTNPSDPTSYGNYDVANRPSDHIKIRYIVIHDTEGSYSSGIATFQDPSQFASANYVIRSADGQITQMVPDGDIAWHAANYYYNMHAIGIEHEGVAVQGATWYTEQMYQNSARLVRYLAKRYGIPLDRGHILGHDEVPGFSPTTQAQQHWDPGPFWDWAHFMDLLNAPVTNEAGTDDTSIVTIDPTFSTNLQTVTSCASGSSCTLPPQGSNFVYLRTSPQPDAPLIADPATSSSGLAGTTVASDWGDKAVTGQKFVRADSQGDWTAIWYGGIEAWLYDPATAPSTVPGTGTSITPKAGAISIPVFGRAYPEPSAYPKGIKPETIVPLQYTMPAGQQYVAINKVRADFYWSPTQTKHRLVQGSTRYYEIFFNHRHAFVRASDVEVVSSGS